MEVPQYPAGPFVPEDNYGDESRRELVASLAAAPAALRDAVAALSDAQLDTPYRNWTVRQIVHHVADSHLNAFVRFKWTLTENVPTIKPYDEGRWVALADSRTGAVRAALGLLDGLHERWVVLLRSMTSDQFARTFLSPGNRARGEPRTGARFLTLGTASTTRVRFSGCGRSGAGSARVETATRPALANGRRRSVC